MIVFIDKSQGGIVAEDECRGTIISQQHTGAYERGNSFWDQCNIQAYGLGEISVWILQLL